MCNWYIFDTVSTCKLILYLICIIEICERYTEEAFPLLNWINTAIALILKVLGYFIQFFFIVVTPSLGFWLSRIQETYCLWILLTHYNNLCWIFVFLFFLFFWKTEKIYINGFLRDVISNSSICTHIRLSHDRSSNDDKSKTQDLNHSTSMTGEKVMSFELLSDFFEPMLIQRHFINAILLRISRFHLHQQTAACLGVQIVCGFNMPKRYRHNYAVGRTLCVKLLWKKYKIQTWDHSSKWNCECSN